MKAHGLAFSKSHHKSSALESKLIEYQHVVLERKGEAEYTSNLAARRLNEICEGLAAHVSLLISHGISPVSERLNDNYCSYKHIILSSLLIQEVERKGLGICPECSRVIIATDLKAAQRAAITG